MAYLDQLRGNIVRASKALQKAEDEMDIMRGRLERAEAAVPELRAALDAARAAFNSELLNTPAEQRGPRPSAGTAKPASAKRADARRKARQRQIDETRGQANKPDIDPTEGW